MAHERPTRPRRPRGGEERTRALHELQSRQGRLFGGVDFSGDMRDPRERTWLAVLELNGDALDLALLEPTGRAGLETHLKDTEAAFLRIEAIGMDFPFSVPARFVRDLLGRAPKGGWWDVARCFEGLSRPAYLKRIETFAGRHGELKRHTDELAGGFSPLHRVNPDLGPMTFHGIRMIGKERSRHALRPFESAKGRYLFEVYPGGFLRKQGWQAGGRARTTRVLAGLAELTTLPVRVSDLHRARCQSQRDALDAVLAARCTAGAVLSGEVDRTPEQLAPDHAAEVKVEGWIYGLADA